MATATILDDKRLPITLSSGLEQFTELPNWLVAIVQPERVRAALTKAVPEIASGHLLLLECEISRVRMKKDRWTGIYQLVVAAPDGGQRRTVATQAALLPPDQDEPAQSADQQSFGAKGWRCYVPELRLLFETQPAESALPSLPVLTDPAQARALLEQHIRAAASAYRDLQIESCTPRVVRYKPGSRCTILYDLTYPADAGSGHSWPNLVAVKTYKGSKGKNAYAGMRALWDSRLGRGDLVTIAEPLAYIPELNALVQGPIREEQTLKDLIRSALRAGTPQALAELDDAMRKTAIGLAALHQSGAQHGEVYTWEEELAEIRETADQLGGAIPQLAGVTEPLLARLEALAAEYPADPAGPTHSSFRPGQVLLYQGTISFIDFDSFCQAEPGLDLALFLSAAKNIGLSEPHEEESNEDDAELAPETRAALLNQLDAICERFVIEYQRHAPVSRQRIALWETLDLLTLVLTCWTKIKPVRLGNTMAMLERHLRQWSALLHETAAPDAVGQSDHVEKDGVADGLWRIAGLPDWLEAAARPEIVGAALERHIPECVAGDLILRSCKLKRMRLKDTSGRWGGVYALKVGDPRSADTQTVQIRATLSAPGIQPGADDERPLPHTFGAAEWRCSVPELGMQFEIEPPDAVLAAMPALSDPEQARDLLERSVRAAGPAYHDLRIERCTPHVLSYKPGTRGTIRYDLQYPSDLALGRGWPEVVIGKTYRGNKGQIAYEGMRALWHSPLAAGDAVTIAEPLAYIPDLKVLFQRSIAEERILEDVLKSALSSGSPEALDELYYFVRKAARGLAALHSLKVHYGEVVTWADRLPDVSKIVDRLIVPLPELANAVIPLLERLKAIDAAQPAGAPVPTHGTFKPEQVLIQGRQIGLIDFDEFCMAEPALDIAVFLAAIKDVGLTSDDTLQTTPAREERLALLESIGEAFLEEYARRAPLSRQRVALWEALEYINDVLDCWIKVKPAEVTTTMLILKHLLRRMEL